MNIVTFNDLATRRAQFGVTQLLLEFHGRSTVEVLMTAMGHTVSGVGENEFVAINDAFDKLTRTIGAALTATRMRTASGGTATTADPLGAQYSASVVLDSKTGKVVKDRTGSRVAWIEPERQP